MTQILCLIFLCSTCHLLVGHTAVQNVHRPSLGDTTFMVVCVNGIPVVVQCTTCAAIQSSPAIGYATNLVLFIYL